MLSSNEGPSVITDLFHRALKSPVTPRVAIAFACFLLVFFITVNHIVHPRTGPIAVGEVAPKDYIAPTTQLYVDTIATNIARDQATAEIAQIFSIDTSINNSMTLDLANFFLRLNELAGELRLLDEIEVTPGRTKKKQLRRSYLPVPRRKRR